MQADEISAIESAKLDPPVLDSSMAIFVILGDESDNTRAEALKIQLEEAGRGVRLIQRKGGGETSRSTVPFRVFVWFRGYILKTSLDAVTAQASQAPSASSLLLEEARRIEGKSTTELDHIAMRKPRSPLHESRDREDDAQSSSSSGPSSRTSLSGTANANSPRVCASGIISASLHPHVQSSLSSSPTSPTPMFAGDLNARPNESDTTSPAPTLTRLAPSGVNRLGILEPHDALAEPTGPTTPHSHARSTHPTHHTVPRNSSFETQDSTAKPLLPMTEELHNKTANTGAVDPQKASKPLMSSDSSWTARRIAMQANYDALRTVTHCGWVVIQGGQLLGTGDSREQAIRAARANGYNPKIDKLAVRIIS